nr:hypothetical protein BaRGS_008265 [Batillaria attramentaria]
MVVGEVHLSASIVSEDKGIVVVGSCSQASYTFDYENKAFPVKTSYHTRMAGNDNLKCDCNMRAIRDWKNSIQGNLARINFENVNCANAGGKLLDQMRNSDFGSCSDSQLAMFESNQKCASCRAQMSQDACDEAGTAGCGSSQAMCQSQIQYQTNRMHITKTCTAYASCLEAERANSRLCRTKSFRLFVTFQVNVTFQPYMMNVASALYAQNTAIYNAKIRDLFVGAEGGYSVKFLYYRNESPYTRVILEVHATNLNTFNANQVISLLKRRLEQDSQQGFLRTQAVITNTIYVGTELTFANQCPAEVTKTPSGDIYWRQANADSTSYVACPGQSADGEGRTAYANRRCVNVDGIAQWDAPDLDACQPPEESDTTRRLEELAGTSIKPGNVNSVLNQLLQLVVDQDQLTADDVTLAMDTVDKVLEEGTALTRLGATDTVTMVLSELADAEPSVWKESNENSNSANRLLAAADRVSREGPLVDGQLMSSAPNLVLAAQRVDSDSFSGLTLTAATEGDTAFQDGEAIRQTGGSSVTDGSGDAKYVTKVNSHVMAASVVDHDVSNLQEPVLITLVHDNEDVYGRGEDLSATDRKILSIISYIGCGVSLLALIFTLITYFMFKKLRRDNPSKILINLCLALALSNFVFLVGMQDYAFNSLAGCKAVSVLLHFFLLSSLSWMAVEAFYMYLALVLVFKTYFTNFILKCSVVGWGVPLVIVIVTLAVNETDNYGPLDSGVCWLKGVAFYAAFVAPVCLILLLNFIAFALVLRTILGLSGRKLNKSDSFTTAQQLRGAIGVVILLGLTWVFGVLAIDQASVVFYYLFAIFNSLQVGDV